MKEHAYAKINLCLNVAGKREDGYHEMDMIMVPVDFYDVLEMVRAEKTTLSVNRYFLPADEKNTVIKAIRVLQKEYHFEDSFACTLTKHIPTQAGLAGGSADAAAAIRILNRMLQLNMSTEDMLRLGAEVGADVPFCCLNQPARVQGIGEIIHPFACTSDYGILLVKPKRGVSTKLAFAEMDQNTCIHPDPAAMQEALMNNDSAGIVRSLGNSLEEASLKLVPEIRTVKENLLELGFDGAMMSGSGSCVFGLTHDRALLNTAAEQFRRKNCFSRTTRILRQNG